MKTVLIVCPRFPPASAADHQRVRMMLPTLEACGWKAVVLAVEAEFVEAPLEPDLLLTIPDSIEIIRCPAIPQRLTRRFRFGSLTLRSLSSLRTAGDRLLGSRQFDLVFFSTTEFGIIPLGRRWKRRFGIPFVVDLQDPWVNSHYSETGRTPPGGRFKHWLTQSVAESQERNTLVAAAHIISVSPQYPKDLSKRHPGLSPHSFSVIPFGGSSRDYEVMEETEQRQSIIPRGDDRRHWLYAGTAPPGIRRTVLGLLAALKQAERSGVVGENEICLHFVGTDYAAAALARPKILALAREAGMESAVREHPSRIPYLQTLRCLKDADAVLILGWDDAGYTASKLYPYILAERPLLCVIHEESSANDVMRRTGAGVTVSFNGRSTEEDIAADIFERWFVTRAFETTRQVSSIAFRPYTAESMTERVAEVFDRVVA
ncbi:MAG: glycosyltransferase [Gemmatimonadaceae bacterium]